MNSRTSKRFRALLTALPADVRRQALKAYRLFEADPSHPSLNFELINPKLGLWSARVIEGYRVLVHRSAIMASYSKEDEADEAKEGGGMPRYLSARPPGDLAEAHQVRQLAHSRDAAADWIMHAKMVVRSWEGQRVRQIAQALGCHPQTVRDRLHAFNECGLEGLGMQPGSGRKPRLSEQERSVILALVKAPPPGKPTYELSGELAAPDPHGEPRRIRMESRMESRSGPWTR